MKFKDVSPSIAMSAIVLVSLASGCGRPSTSVSAHPATPQATQVRATRLRRRPDRPTAAGIGSLPEKR